MAIVLPAPGAPAWLVDKHQPALDAGAAVLVRGEPAGADSLRVLHALHRLPVSQRLEHVHRPAPEPAARHAVSADTELAVVV